jgi:nitroimidazol reductase NimA-like FMN-containing flavoprotein (pyridoxamine 5'-phosphate oxidase superfamily)
MGQRRSHIHMSDTEIADFLASQSTLVLGTTGPDGWPHMTTISYGMLDGSLVMASFRRAQKVVNARREMRVTCLVETNQHHYATTRGVLVFGKATVFDDVDTVLQASEAIVATRRRVLGSDAFVPTDSVVGSASKRSVISVTPERFASWNHQHLGGTY